MREHYERRLIRVRPRSWRGVVSAVTSSGAEAVGREGGKLFGLFLPQIGLAASEGILLTLWPDAGRESPILTGAGDVLSSEVERLVATVRPHEPVPPKEPGVYAHRRFELREADWPEFLELSNGAWPTFEKTFGAEIIGFWRSLDVEVPKARVHLLTRYPDLDAWERSRIPNARDSSAREAMQRFVRRHELTEFTIVVTTELGSR